MFAHRRYRFGHAWFCVQEDGSVLVGADKEFYEKVGLVVYCDLPFEHDKLVKGQVCVKMLNSNQYAPQKFLSPLSGTVVRINEKMLTQPYLAQKDPYGEAWLFVMVPSRFGEELNQYSGVSDGKNAKCLVIGMGNRFRSDDAAGILAATELRKLHLPRHVDVIYGGTDELSLIEHFMSARRVVIIDAVSMGKPPGTVSIFCADEVNMISDSDSTSLHGFGLADTIALTRTLGISPDIAIIGIEPQSTEYGEELTSLIALKVPLLVRIAMNLVGLPGFV